MSWIDDLANWLFPKGSKPHAVVEIENQKEKDSKEDEESEDK